MRQRIAADGRKFRFGTVADTKVNRAADFDRQWNNGLDLVNERRLVACVW